MPFSLFCFFFLYKRIGQTKLAWPLLPLGNCWVPPIFLKEFFFFLKLRISFFLCCHYLNSFQVCDITFAGSSVFDSGSSVDRDQQWSGVNQCNKQSTERSWQQSQCISFPSPSGFCLFIIIIFSFIYFSSRLWPVCFFSLLLLQHCSQQQFIYRLSVWENSSLWQTATMEWQ